MRLLTFDTGGTLSLTKDLVDNVPPYAILSHTWGADEDELTFDDVVHGRGKSKAGYYKVNFCGQQAWIDNINHFWVDTCCINKANHAELSEAITSMFRWYRDAVKCYVYLPDVSAGEKNDNGQTGKVWESAFRSSRWFTRGWTLQELLAPRSVEFYSSEERLLGDRTILKKLVHEITHIPVSALQGASLSEFSVDERLRWATERNTKKIEDKAYCLLGLFDIFMPLMYGEGENAMTRLRKKIDKRLTEANTVLVRPGTRPTVPDSSARPPPIENVFSIDSVSLGSGPLMDPLASMDIVLTAVTKATNMLRSCQKRAARLKIADLAIAALHTECSSIRLRINQIRALMVRNGSDTFGERLDTYTIEDYGDVLRACYLHLSILNTRFGSLEDTQAGDLDRVEYKSKLLSIWALPHMDKMSQNIKDLARAVDILCSVFQSESSRKPSTDAKDADVKQILASISSDTVSLLDFFHETQPDEDHSSESSVLGNEVFAFDEILQNTPLYRRAQVRRMVRPLPVDLYENRIAEETSPPFPTKPPRGPALVMPESTKPLATIWPLHNPFDDESELDTEPVPVSTTTEVQHHLPNTKSPSGPRLSPILGGERRKSIDSQSSDSTIRLKSPKSSILRPNPVTKASLEGREPKPGTWEDGIPVAVRDMRPVKSSRAQSSPYPTLLDILNRRTVKPYSLYEYYIYMRDVQRAVDYLDFLLDTQQHVALCRHYVRDHPRELVDQRSSLPSSAVSLTPAETGSITRADIRASAEGILYTYVLPGCEREIVLPDRMVDHITRRIEDEGRDDPEVFDDAKYYVFEAMERDSLSGFLKWQKPVLGVQAFSRARILRPFFTRLPESRGTSGSVGRL